MTYAHTLPAELTIYNVVELRNAMLAWLGDEATSTGMPLAVDASAVADVDGAGVQLLLSLARSLADRGRELHLAVASPALSAACHALGAGQLLTHSATREVA